MSDRDPCFLDVETRSVVDLRKTGAYVYAEDPTTDVIVACYAFGAKGEIRTWLRGQPMPADLREHVEAGGTLVAHNAEFERALWRGVLAPRYGWTLPRLEQWVCTAALANAMALPRSLEGVGAALGLKVQKDMQGNALMLRMCRPRSIEADGTIIWWEDEERMSRLAAYCAKDVEVTQLVYPRLRPLTPIERDVWLLDARINDRGVYIDRTTVEAAKRVVAGAEVALLGELRTLTAGEVSTAKQVEKLRTWLAANGLELPSLEKAEVEAALAKGPHPPAVQRALEIRKELSKSSTGKLDAMLARRCRDGRARGNLMYHGATTGRWAGVGIQMQNLPRGSIDNAESCLTAIATGDYRVVEMIWDSPLSAVSSALRSMITGGPGRDLIAADFSNIEGRVLAWLAGEAWKLDAFRDFDAGTGPDLYKLAYSRSFNVPVANVSKNDRQVGKVMELALGYQGGVGAFQSMARIYGVEVADAKADELKRAWRGAHPATVSFWYALEDAARNAVLHPKQIFTAGRIGFAAGGGFLWMKLPSGRLLGYPRPSVKTVESKFGPKEVVHFWGVDTFTRDWSEQTTYGGKLAENATQAVARDVMAEALLRVERAGFPVILSVHDEAVSEVPAGTGDVAAYEAAMTTLPTWASGLPVAAEGWTGKRYRK